MTHPLLQKILEKKNNFKTMIVLGVAALLFLILIVCMIVSHKHTAFLKNKTVNEKAATIEPFQKISEFNESATGEAISDLQTNASLQSQQIDNLKKQNEKLSDQLEQVNAIDKNIPENITIQKPESITASQNTPVSLLQSPIQLQNLNALPGQKIANVVEHRNTGLDQAGISDFSFSYESEHNTETIDTACTPENCVLPGTFARAVMLGAADANASVNGQSNTTPILFRILNKGILPNGYHSHLQGCFVVGEVYGDISSERGEVKLSQISCVFNGKTISKSINGTAYFMGKEGVRGRAIMRNGPLLWNAGVAGMLSGLAQGVEQAQQTQSISPLGTTATVPSDRIAMSMGAGGVQSAANTLANYYIKRADQYHPIIELNAGTIVNLVFLNQFMLTPDSSQSSGAITTQNSSNNYWKNQPASNNHSNENENTLSYGDSVNQNDAAQIQNQINQAGNTGENNENNNE